ncbi:MULTISPECIES: hypothetical protein [unclassified Luteococcus]
MTRLVGCLAGRAATYFLSFSQAGLAALNAPGVDGQRADLIGSELDPQA